MAIYYLQNPGGNDANPGTQVQPWLTLQHAATTAVAGDTVYIEGGEVIAGTVLFNVNAGTQGNYIQFIGANTINPLVVDGTRYDVNGNNAVNSVINISQNYIYLENITTHNGAWYGFEGNQNGIIYRCCYSYAMGLAGFYGGNRGVTCIRCSGRNHTGASYNRMDGGSFLFCDSIGAGTSALTQMGTPKVIGCLLHDSAVDATEDTPTTFSSLYLHNVIDGNVNGVDLVAGTGLLTMMYNRLTNQSGNAADMTATSHILEDFNFFLNNAGDVSAGGQQWLGANSLFAGVEGYAGGAGGGATNEFDLTDLATGRRTPIQIGCV